MLGIRHYQNTAVDLYQGDITRFVCDVMVTAANEGLRGGGGVDAAIHGAGGPTIAEQCRAIGHCPTGKAVVTTAGRLPAAKLVHAVGPIWQGGNSGEDAKLTEAIHASLALASQNEKPAHIALPAISTGIYGFPLERAANVSLKAVQSFLDSHTQKPRRITFVLFDGQAYRSFQDQLFALFPET